MLIFEEICFTEGLASDNGVLEVFFDYSFMFSNRYLRRKV